MSRVQAKLVGSNTQQSVMKLTSRLYNRLWTATVCLTIGLLFGFSPIVSAAAAQPTDTQATYWGRYTSAQNGPDEHNSPAIVNFDAPIQQIATSNSDDYALLTNGTVWAWGQGQNGELGNGATSNSYDVPVQVQFPAGVTIAYLPTDVMPAQTALAVDTNGNVWGWGLNLAGELCLGNTTEQNSPVELPLTNVTSLAGADDHEIFDAGGTVYACGGNLSGDLGDGSTTPSSIPVAVTGLPTGVAVTTLVAAWNNSGALLANGQYYDWGYNANGQLGNGTTIESNVPVAVNLPAAVNLVSLGGSLTNNGQTLAYLANGSLWSWGDNQYGQLGNGNTTSQTSPVQVKLLTGGNSIIGLATNADTSYAILNNDSLYAWGYGGVGQLGNGTTNNSMTPVLVETGVNEVSATAWDAAAADITK